MARSNSRRALATIPGLVGALARLEAPLRGLDGGVALCAALQDLRIGKDDCGNIGAQIERCVEREEVREFDGQRGAARRRRQERHLEFGLLCDIHNRRLDCGYGEQQKRAKSRGSNFHPTASAMKIKYFCEP